MKIVLPKTPTTFVWNADAVAPAVALSTDATGPHKWTWKLVWKKYTASGSVQTPTNQWDAIVAAGQGGGALSVTAQAGTQSASVTIKITGANPTPQQVTQFLTTQPDGPNFDKILKHESHARHFDGQGEPLVSFDHGYGMCQLTTPPPSFLQAWSWKSNVQGGLALFATKKADAIRYLSQAGRTYTDDQLAYETVSRWNGGSYHAWTDKGWARKPNILCDTKTGNIGWDITDTENKDKTEDQLHKRDAASYSKAPGADAHWMYSGVCYADRVLG